jgi:hypothetical protein
MTAKEVRDLVNNINLWGGNAFTLAMRVAEKQREDDAAKAEELGQPEVAEAIRAAS